ncbi:MAG: class II fumarate hydratase [Candidatus Nanopelagicales bacterium]|jgi:fumarate hydratase class II|nr:class II fumarate hydratase [Candidatus Nanopelagicales bacterium]
MIAVEGDGRAGGFRIETDSLGEVRVPADRLWGAQTQRAIEHFAIGREPMPAELVDAYAVIKRAAAGAHHRAGRIPDDVHGLIVRACDELLAGQHRDMFPLHVWVSGSGTQLNMNVNEVIANRCSQLAGTPMGSKHPVHPNDHVNMGQSTNDTFPTAMHVAVAREVVARVLPAVRSLQEAIAQRSATWDGIVKIGRTHLQDATPLTLGQEWSGYATMLAADAARIEATLGDVYELALGGTAVGTGVNAPQGFAEAAIAEVAALTGLPFVPAGNPFAAQGSHDALVHLHQALRTLAVSLTKIANDIRLLGSGPRSGLGELRLPANEPGSSIMPGKVNPSQVEALTMACAQVLGNDVAVGLAGAGGHLEMNAFKPLLAHAVLQSTSLLADGCLQFRRDCVEGIEPDRGRIAEHVERSLMLVTALSPVIGYDRAARIAHHALERDQTLREAALELGLVDADAFDRIVRPERMVRPDGTSSTSSAGG